MKKILLMFILAALWHLHAEPLGKFDNDAQIWRVSNGKFKCTFFQGCMYPAWFTNSKDAEFPFFVLNDFFIVNNVKYYLTEERWAEFDIKENSSKRFVIAIKGNFCHGLAPFNKPYKNVNLTYLYTIEKNSGKMQIDITVDKQKAEDIKFYFIRPRWRFLPFTELKYADGKIISLSQRFNTGKQFTAVNSSLQNQHLRMTFSKNTQNVQYENRENGFLTVAEKNGEIFSPASEKKLQFSTALYFEEVTE
jgi:hypothetical protein